MANFVMATLILVKFDPVLLCFCLVLAIVAGTLIGFILQQMWYVSVNKTQIELEKIDALKEEWKKAGINKKYVHAYGHGFIQNWKEFLFPGKAKLHEPKSYTAELDADKNPEQKPREKARENKKRR
jgi:uncharacterized membrane protein YraQ (UPF0718 family)